MPDAEPMSMLEGRLTSELDADLQCIVVRHATDAGEAKAFELYLAEVCGGGGAGSEGSCLLGVRHRSFICACARAASPVLQKTICSALPRQSCLTLRPGAGTRLHSCRSGTPSPA